MANDPDDVDARFAELVAQFDDPNDVAGSDDGEEQWGGADIVGDGDHDPTAGQYVSGYRDPLGEDDEPFVPPAAPPFPRGTKRTRWGWAGALGCPVGYFVLWGSGRQPDSFTMFLLAVGFVTGAGVLIAGMRTTSPDEEDDDGAVV
jgi:hypothetical protein